MSLAVRLGLLPPVPTEVEREALALRADLDARVEAARVRLEAAESLAPSAAREALLICRALGRDLAALLPALADEGGDAALGKRIDDLVARLGERGHEDSAEAARVAGDLRGILRDLAQRNDAMKRTVLRTRLDAFRRRTRIRVGAAVGIAALLLAAIVLRRAPAPATAVPDLQGAALERDFAAGTTALNAGDFAGAVDLFSRAVAALPDDRRSADAYNSLGWSLYKLGRYDQAIAAYERSIALDPAAARTRNNLELAKRDRDAKHR